MDFVFGGLQKSVTRSKRVTGGLYTAQDTETQETSAAGQHITTYEHTAKQSRRSAVLSSYNPVANGLNGCGYKQTRQRPIMRRPVKIIARHTSYIIQIQKIRAPLGRSPHQIHTVDAHHRCRHVDAHGQSAPDAAGTLGLRQQGVVHQLLIAQRVVPPQLPHGFHQHVLPYLGAQGSGVRVYGSGYRS